MLDEQIVLRFTNNLKKHIKCKNVTWSKPRKYRDGFEVVLETENRVAVIMCFDKDYLMIDEHKFYYNDPEKCSGEEISKCIDIHCLRGLQANINYALADYLMKYMAYGYGFDHIAKYVINCGHYDAIDDENFFKFCDDMRRKKFANKSQTIEFSNMVKAANKFIKTRDNLNKRCSKYFREDDDFRILFGSRNKISAYGNNYIDWS